jgi:hypothetical protein
MAGRGQEFEYWPWTEEMEEAATMAQQHDGTMAGQYDRSPATALGDTDAGSLVYETIATLEYTGRPVTRGEIAEATGLELGELDQVLSTLTEQGQLTCGRNLDGEPAFAPSSRGWSANPGKTRGM